MDNPWKTFDDQNIGKQQKDRWKEIVKAMGYTDDVFEYYKRGYEQK